MSYYVEPDYWVSGYAVGDSAPSTILAAGLISATATIKSSGSYTSASNASRVIATSTVLVGGSFTQTFPGINLNSKSQTFVAGNITTSSGSLVSETSDVRMTGRPFWELTSPAAGTWTLIVPQSEGSGH